MENLLLQVVLISEESRCDADPNWAPLRSTSVLAMIRSSLDSNKLVIPAVGDTSLSYGSSAGLTVKLVVTTVHVLEPVSIASLDTLTELVSVSSRHTSTFCWEANLLSICDEDAARH